MFTILNTAEAHMDRLPSDCCVVRSRINIKKRAHPVKRLPARASCADHTTRHLAPLGRELEIRQVGKGKKRGRGEGYGRAAARAASTRGGGSDVGRLFGG